MLPLVISKPLYAANTGSTTNTRTPDQLFNEVIRPKLIELLSSKDEPKEGDHGFGIRLNEGKEDELKFIAHELGYRSGYILMPKESDTLVITFEHKTAPQKIICRGYDTKDGPKPFPDDQKNKQVLELTTDFLNGILNGSHSFNLKPKLVRILKGPSK